MPTCFTVSVGDVDLDKQQLFPNPITGSEVWSAGGPSVHCTNSGECVYNRRPPLPEEASLSVMGGQLEVECYGRLDLVVHCGEGEGVPVTLDDVAVVPGFGNVMSIDQMRMQSPVTLGPTGVSAFNDQLRFVHGFTGNYIQASRVPPGGAPAQ